ncbi:hypothetical protein HOLleu_20093 [Holothuria leucospilota]|uniref:B box-type domain-containing protein n=1 Tax=Holothuria leucospilota TaxID=206669 RepID=A0A9Q1H861_HOLLE|nr:hypothetical protein HOLleu_20093 [Holothuria leucospilota]
MYSTSVTLAWVRGNSTRKRWNDLGLGIQSRHSKNVCPIVFGGGQRSSGVTRGQKPKTLLTRFFKDVPLCSKLFVSAQGEAVETIMGEAYHQVMAGTTEQTYDLSSYQILVTKLQRDLTLDEMKDVLKELDVDRNTITSLESCNFVDVLQIRGILPEGGGGQLYLALKRCHLDKVATHVKIYEDSLKEEHEAGKETEDHHPGRNPDPPVTNCDLHPQYTLELFCNTCNRKICYQCVFLNHRDKTHNVLSKQDIEGQIETTVDMLKQRIHGLKDKLESVRENIEEFEKRKHVGNFSLVDAQANLWHDLLKQHEEQLRIALTETKQCIEHTLLEMKATAQETEKSIKIIGDAISKTMQDGEKLQQLELLVRWKKRLTESKTKVQKACSAKENITLLFRPLSASGVFAELRFGNVVGAITLSQKYALIVKDERNTGMKIVAHCVSFETQQRVWYRELEDFECKEPVIIAPNLYGTGVQSSVMIALGRSLTSITVERKNEECSISKVVSFTLENLAYGNYVTAMTTITSGNRDVGMLIASNASTKLSRFNAVLKYDRDIDCSSVVHSIYSVACVDNEIAIVDSVREEIVLLKISGDGVMISGKLHVTENVATIPKMIQWDGNFWTVLFVSKEDIRGEIQWETVNYFQDSRKFSSSGNGKCDPQTTAVSLSFILDRTSVCFSDGTVKEFPTVLR